MYVVTLYYFSENYLKREGPSPIDYGNHFGASGPAKNSASSTYCIKAGCGATVIMPSRKLRRPVNGFGVVDSSFVCNGGCGYVCARSTDARQHARECPFLALAGVVVSFACEICTFSTVHRANLTKHIKKMHGLAALHLCRCGRPCGGTVQPAEVPAAAV